MKNIYSFFKTIIIAKTSYLAFITLLGFTQFALAQVRLPFTQRTSQYSPTKVIYNIKGDFQMIGNTNLTLLNYGDNTNNSNNDMKLVDMDGVSSTANSSSATLTLSTENGAIPSCSNIIYAGLYWTGRTDNNITTDAKRSVKIKGPGQTNYQSFIANANDIRYPGDDNMYAAYIEVTDLVKQYGVGEYWVADMALSTGNGGGTGYYGGWGMVVVYENSKMKWRDVTVFDGFAYVRGNTSINYDIDVSGINTVQTGQVNMKLGMMAGEGDVGISGDYFQISDHTNTNWISLNHAGNSATNFFNSSVYTGGNTRNPDLKNNTGIDISMFNIPNTGNSVITNNQTSTKFRYGSTQDTYIIYSLVMAVDAYIPYPEGLTTVQTINGIPANSTMNALPGQDVEMTLDIRNKGTEVINNTKIIIPIPFATTFDTSWRVINFTPAPTPNNFYFDPSLGASGSIVWDLGSLPVPADPNKILGTITYKLKVTEDCILLSNPDCVPIISINGTFSGTGAISKAEFSNVGFIRGYEENGTCIGEPITTPTKLNIDAFDYVANHCQGIPVPIEFDFCNSGPSIPITDISAAFPVGSRFYSEYPVTASTLEYTINNPFPATPGVSTYFTLPPTIGACYFAFTINVTAANSVPLTTNVTSCKGENLLPLTATPTNPDYTLYYYLTPASPPQLSITPLTDEVGQKIYYVKEGKSGSCISSNMAQIVVFVDSCPDAPTVTTMQPVCPVTSGTIMVTASTGVGMTYSLDGVNYSNTTGVFTSLPPGVYPVTAKNATGCISKETIVTIDELTTDIVFSSPVIQNVSCSGGNNGSISIVANGGTGSISYSINPNIGIQAAPGNFTQLTAQMYTITATDQLFCTTNTSITLGTDPDTIAPQLIQVPADTTLECSSVDDIITSSQLVVNGDFSDTIPPFKFSTGYVYQPQIPGNRDLEPEGLYSIGSDAYSYHYDFFGTGRSGVGDNFLIVNGYPGAPQPIVWSDTITDIKPGSIYYFSAWARSLNDAGFYANLKFSINGTQIGVPTGPLPAGPADNTSPSQWIKFYGVWTANTTDAVLSIIDLTTDADGNDFGLDDIAFGLTVNADDNCDPNPVVVQTETRTDGNCPNNYTLVRTWTATDASGNSSSASQTIKVQDITAPVIDALPAITTINCPSTPVFTAATATDACGNTFSLTYIDITTPGACSGSYSVTRTWTATDSCGNSSTASQTINVQDNTPPLISAVPETTTINCPAIPEFTTPTATDICDSNPSLTFVDVIAPGACAGSYSITRIWTAKDACGNTSTASQTIIVLDNMAPVIAALPEPTTINCPAIPDFTTATAIDACGSDFNLTFNDVTTPGTCAGSYSVTRTWTATDACGNTSTASQTINVQDNTAPIIAALPETTTIYCPATPEFVAASATDACESSINLTFTDITLPGTCPGSYSVTRTWTATDGCGNRSTASQTINVQDNTPPLISTLPETTTINCPAIPEFATTTATDACGSNVDLTYADITTPGTCPGSYSVTRTWIATDACGNSSTAFQIINVQDITAPVITCLANIAVNVEPGVCGATVTVPQPTALDNCSTVTLSNSVNQTSNASGFYPAGITTIVWTATDICGNYSTCQMTVTVTDNILPVITCPAEVNACSNEQVELGTATATDNCGIATITNNAPSVFNPGTTLVVWTATDISGNISSCTQTVNVSSALIVNAGIDTLIIVGTAATLHGTVTGGSGSYSYNWSPEDSLVNNTILNPTTLPLSTQITFTLTALDMLTGCSNSDEVTVSINYVRPEIEITNLVTPNGDGMNDYWHIFGIDLFPDNNILLFNRWGDKIRDFQSYNNTTNNWDGTNNKNEYLPDGVYFYIVTITDKEAKTGWIYLRGKGDN
jgi:gliding motility-associated-like protein